jgi:hypothetical protein
MKKDPRIAIIGAGPSGLLTAHYLRKNGYRNVFVLEKRGRVGGLADTMTYDGRSFDLGANYITPAYTEIRKLAKELGATTYAERPFIAMKLNVPEGKATLGSLVTAMRERSNGTTISMLSFAWSNIRYIWKRFWLGSIIDQPTFAGIENHTELTVPMQEWLDKNGLSDLVGVFKLPVNLMGYGTVQMTPAIYALKFMTLKSFVPMLIKEMPIIGRFSGWPRRFTDGFQRLFVRLSWKLNVRLGVDIQEVRRSDDGVHIRYRQPEQILNELGWRESSLDVDHVILACPLTADNIGFLHLDDRSEEKEFLGHIKSVSYCMTTRHVTGHNFDGENPLAACYPQSPMDEYLPWGVAKQWDDSDFTQFYTRVDTEEAYEPVQERVEEGVQKIVDMMGGKLTPESKNWQTYNRFPYFQHVDGETIRKGWYTHLEENWQGRNNTYYVGGATNFELIETIAEYTKHLVATHFPKQGAG